jgi:hypothetical protein
MNIPNSLSPIPSISSPVFIPTLTSTTTSSISQSEDEQPTKHKRRRKRKRKHTVSDSACAVTSLTPETLRSTSTLDLVSTPPSNLTSTSSSSTRPASNPHKRQRKGRLQRKLQAINYRCAHNHEQIVQAFQQLVFLNQ